VHAPTAGVLESHLTTLRLRFERFGIDTVSHRPDSIDTCGSWLLSSGMGVQCPLNVCSGFGSNGQAWYFSASTNGNGAYFPVEGPGWTFSTEAGALAGGALWAQAATQDNGIENCGMTYGTIRELVEHVLPLGGSH
jgi:hypothetical protein